METKKAIDNLVESLFLTLPVIHKRIMKIRPPDIECGIRISRIHFGILVALHHHRSPVTEIANLYLISKPQMTFIMNQMVEAGLITRTVNARDRRIKDTELTARGEELFLRCDKYIKNNVKKLFAGLSEKDVREMTEALQKLKDIGLRETGEKHSSPRLTEIVHQNRN